MINKNTFIIYSISRIDSYIRFYFLQLNLVIVRFIRAQEVQKKATLPADNLLATTVATTDVAAEAAATSAAASAAVVNPKLLPQVRYTWAIFK